MLRSSLLARLVLAAALAGPALAWAAEPTIIYVTRHAEKAPEGKDPALTAHGQARARTLAALLAKTGIGAVYSTATTRTKQTAQPLAARLGVPVQTYEAAAPQAMIANIKAAPAPTLVVGHSNTIGDLVRQMGGAPGTPIGDDEYDRLYQLIINADGSVTTVLLSSVVAP